MLLLKIIWLQYPIIEYSYLGKYGISFDGMESGFKLGDMLKNKALATIKLEAFDLRTDPCLPKPIKTEKMKLAPLIGIMFACFISCILDAYCARWRSMICNKFFPERATSRSRYLYKKIQAGRGQRRYQLRLIAIREKLKADRLLDISIGGKLGQYWQRLMGCLGIQAKLYIPSTIKFEKRCSLKLVSKELNHFGTIAAICWD